MDEAAEFFFKAIFWMLAAPFWLAWKIVTLLWRFAFKPAIEHRNEQAATNHAQQHSQQNADRQKARDESRAKQLTALKAAAPLSPPERMRATIQINEYKQPRVQRQRVSRLIGEDNYVYVEAGEKTRFSVDMILEMSETERAIIREHELDDVVLEETSDYTEDRLREIEAEYHDEIEETKDPILKEVKKQTTQQTLAMMKKDRTKTRIGDLLVSPFSRAFASPHEAKEYADKLKTKFLPAIRKLLDGYSTHKKTETLEF